MDVRSGEREMVDVMGEIGFLEGRWNRGEVLINAANFAGVELMRYLVVESGAMGIGCVPKGELCNVLGIAVGAATRNLNWTSGDDDVVRFLLGVRGEDGTKVFDPNGVDYGTYEVERVKIATALCNAVRCGNVGVVKILLGAGAKMVVDYGGVTLLALAEQMRSKNGAAGDEIVKLLEAWLEERGLPRDHVDEPDFVREWPATVRRGD